MKLIFIVKAIILNKLDIKFITTIRNCGYEEVMCSCAFYNYILNDLEFGNEANKEFF